MQLENVLGDVGGFYSRLVSHLLDVGVVVGEYPLSHVCYRTAEFREYETKRDKLKSLSREFVEEEFNGRPVSMFVLRDLISLRYDLLGKSELKRESAIELVELPSPKSAQMYPSGLEHIGFVVGRELHEFDERFKGVFSGHKDRGPHCQPSFITFADGSTAKFYERPLKEIVRESGWVFRLTDSWSK